MGIDQRLHLGQHVATQGGITAADEVDRRRHGGHDLQHVAGHPGGQLHRAVLGQAAAVGQDEARGARLGQGTLVLRLLERGDHLDVVHALRAGGVVVEDHGPAALGVPAGADPRPGVEDLQGRRQFVQTCIGHSRASHRNADLTSDMLA
jgi:hypothetical protein